MFFVNKIIKHNIYMYNTPFDDKLFKIGYKIMSMRVRME